MAEAFAPSFGALGLGGVVAFVFGSIILLDTDVPGFQIARCLIGGMALRRRLVVLLIGTYFARSRRRPVVTGAEQLLRERADRAGRFRRARPSASPRRDLERDRALAGQAQASDCVIVRVEGLTVEVEPEEAIAQQRDDESSFLRSVRVEHRRRHPVVILLFSAIKILNEYERGVMFTLGRYTGTRDRASSSWFRSSSAWSRSTCA